MTAMNYPPHLQPTRSIGRTQAILIKLYGPAESWDHPLIGTKYDPRLAEYRQGETAARWRARRADRALRRGAGGAWAATVSLPLS